LPDDYEAESWLMIMTSVTVIIIMIDSSLNHQVDINFQVTGKLNLKLPWPSGRRRARAGVGPRLKL
jgi:hypothetical protein